MKSRLAILAVLAVLTSLPTYVHSQQSIGDGRRSELRQRALERLDTDGDGEIGTEERAAIRDRIGQRGDQQGRLNARELRRSDAQENSSEARPGTTLVTFRHSPDGLDRSYLLHLPQGKDSYESSPVVIVMHPGLANGQWMEAETGFSELADAEGFIAVYPNGTRQGQTWPTQNTLLWDGAYTLRCTPPGIPDDEGFLVAIIDQLKSNYDIDAERVFMTGFSHGAQMTNTMAFRHPDLLAGIAPVSGGWLDAWADSTDAFSCMASSSEIEMESSLSTWIWRGSAEHMTNNPKTMPRAEQDQLQKQWFMEHNGVDTTPSIETETIEYANRRGQLQDYTLTTEKYVDGSNGSVVYFTEVSSESHRWQPGATGRIWAFFKQLADQPL